MALVWGLNGKVDVSMSTTVGGTVDLDTAGGERIALTGTNAVTNLGAGAVTTWAMILFESATPLVNSAALQLVGNANRTTAPGAIGFYSFDGAGHWIEVEYSEDGVSFGGGVTMLFVQATAPIGWTKVTTHNDKALRVVSGTPSSGGSAGFSSVFGAGKNTGDTTLTLSHLPSDHKFLSTFADNHIAGGGAAAGTDINSPVSDPGGSSFTALPAGGGTGHHHSLSLDLFYVDVIICSKN